MNLVKKIFIGSLILVFCGLAFISYNSASPRNFPNKVTVNIKSGTSLSQAAEQLENAKVVRSDFFYKLYVVLLGGSKRVVAGNYLFDTPQTSWQIAWRTLRGDLGLPKIKVTIPEGIASYDIARLLEKKLPNFNKKEFLDLAKPSEGYLFPDTYYFYENMTSKEIVTLMKDNFERKINKLRFAIQFSGRSFEDVVRMASIVEKEASSTADRKVIAGILWKRIDSSYPLQVDAPFFYTLGKDSSELTRADLASDSPYNLYVNKGLPPTPITNPGLGAIDATLHPIESDYWFYLSDAHGNTHYAATHDGHLANREKYLQ